MRSRTMVMAVMFLAAAALTEHAAAQAEMPPRGGVQRTPVSVVGRNGVAVRTPAQVRRATPKQPSCWQEAGISRSAMEQRRAIEQQTKARVGSVCADPSLSDQQKRQEIRQIHQQAHQQIESLISPQQQEALKQCQMARAKEHPHVGGGGVNVHHGPCD